MSPKPFDSTYSKNELLIAPNPNIAASLPVFPNRIHVVAKVRHLEVILNTSLFLANLPSGRIS